MDVNSDSPLGKSISFPENYAPELLYPISRTEQRAAQELAEPLPFSGFDQWICHEISWLSPSGMPRSAVGRIRYPCSTPAMIESKSLKLFLGSMNDKIFENDDDVVSAVKSELQRVLQSSAVQFQLMTVTQWAGLVKLRRLGTCLEGSVKQGAPPANVPAAAMVKTHADLIDESLYCEVFRSLCPVTGQPDWATVEISYRGARLDRAALLSYLLAYRKFSSYHEDCCERIFSHIRGAQMSAGAFDKLMVACRFSRRGGIDLTPVRFSENISVSGIELSIR